MSTRRRAVARGLPTLESLLVATIILLAFLIRVAYLSESQENPFFDDPIIDAAEYHGWASTIASGQWLWTRAHIHGPLYPYLIALLLKWGASFSGLYLFNHLVGLATLLLLYDTARVWGGRTVAFLSLAIGLVYARFLYFEGLLLATTLVAFLDLLLVRVALELARRKTRPVFWGLLGAVLGLSAVTRPTVLVVLPAIALGVWKRSERTESVQRMLAVAGGVALFVGPVFLRNLAVGDPVLIQANGGMNFYIANRAGADGLASVRPGMEWKDIERLAAAAGAVREVDRDRFYYREGLRAIASEPGQAARRFAKRFLLFWGGWEVDTSQDFRFFQSHSRLLRILLLPAGVILPLSVLGFLRAIRSGASRNPPFLFLASYLVVILLFPYSSRYRMPVFPVLILFAAAALPPLVKGLARGLTGWRSVLLLAGLFFLLNGSPVSLPEGGVVRTYQHLGKRLYGLGDYAGALHRYDRALEKRPDDADIWNDRGLALEALDDQDGAREAYEKAVGYAPNHGKARANLAGIFYRQGKDDSALVELGHAVRAEPGNADFYNNLGVLLLKKGEVKQAVEVLETGARIDPVNTKILYNLGKALGEAGRHEEALGFFRRLAEIQETKQVRFQLGRMAERSDQIPLAVREYSRALEIDPGYPEALRNLGLLLWRAGRVPEALSYLDRYLVRHPQDAVVRDLVRQARGEGG